MYNLFMVRYKHCQEMQTFLLASIMHKYMSLQCVQSTSARALVKKTQEPGIKLQKADFFRNDTWTSPQTNSEEAPKIPLVRFF